jgi:hypothetical protein
VGEVGVSDYSARVEFRTAGINCAIAYLVDDKGWPVSIAKTFADARMIESPVGFGPGLATEFLVSSRANLASFAALGQLALYAGLVLVPMDSGRINGNLRRLKRCSPRTRRVLCMAAWSTIRVGGTSCQFYDRKRAERLDHTQALLALARRCVAPEGFSASAPRLRERADRRRRHTWRR